jgi:hypothetical protein
MVLLPGLVAALAALAACGQPAGAACTAKGSGFSLRDSCDTRCLSLSSVVCPDASRVSPAVCAGRKGCKPGTCPADQVCYAFEDPENEISYCLPANVCAAVPDPEMRVRWEQESAARAAATLARNQAIRDHRAGRRLQPVEQPASATEPNRE